MTTTEFFKNPNNKLQILAALAYLSREARRSGECHLSSLLGTVLKEALHPDITDFDLDSLSDSPELLNVLEFITRFRAASKNTQRCVLASIEEHDETLKLLQ